MLLGVMSSTSKNMIVHNVVLGCGIYVEATLQATLIGLTRLRVPYAAEMATFSTLEQVAEAVCSLNS